MSILIPCHDAERWMGGPAVRAARRRVEDQFNWQAISRQYVREVTA